MRQLYVGLMSGTSVDGIDAVLVDFSEPQPQLLSMHAHAIPCSLVEQIQQLIEQKYADGTTEINLMGKVDRQLGYLFADAVNALCKKAQINPKDIIAVGSHGQTIRHYPDGEQGFTLQIGDANTIAVQCDIDVVADFRKKDVALGGQGAPLVPAFHHSIFGDKHKNRVIVNLGGIANLTYLPALNSTQATQQQIIGYDTGPSNTLLDQWCQQHTQQAYDKDGAWARSGQLNSVLLQQLLNDDYFHQGYPKSTGREKFNLNWLKQHNLIDGLNSADVQNTLVHLTAKSIAEQIKRLGADVDVFTCGGGSHNGYLIEVLGDYLKPYNLASSEALGVHPDWVEAIAFAWLAHAHIHKKPGNIASVTGASRAAILGCFYPA